MSVVRYGLLGLVGAVLLVSGCGSSAHNTWKYTRGLYYEYLNPPASIDYEDHGDIDAAQIELTLSMQGIDQELTRLERYLNNQDKPPSGETVGELFNRFPWISGIAAIDQEGNLLAQDPPYSLKQLDFSPLAASSALGDRALRGDIQVGPLGSEILLGVPIFIDFEFRGVFIPHFDIRMLLSRVQNPANFVILSTQGVLWPGAFVYEQTPLAEQDWSELLADEAQGRVSNEHGSFVWISRYLGGVPLIFAVPEKGHTFATNPAQLDALPSSGFFPAPVPTPSLQQESAPTDFLGNPDMGVTFDIQ